MLVIDDFSRLMWVSFLREKIEALEKFKKFKVLDENQIGRKLKAICSDRGGELCQDISKNYVTNMELKENILFQVLLNKMELQNAKIDQFNIWQGL